MEIPDVLTDQDVGPPFMSIYGDPCMSSTLKISSSAIHSCDLPWFRSPVTLVIVDKDRDFYVEKLVPHPLCDPAKRWRKWRHRLCLRAIGPAALKWKRIQKSKNARVCGSCTYSDDQYLAFEDTMSLCTMKKTHQNWPRNATASRHLSFLVCKHEKVSRDAILTSLPVHFRIFRSQEGGIFKDASELR